MARINRIFPWICIVICLTASTLAIGPAPIVIFGTAYTDIANVEVDAPAAIKETYEDNAYLLTLTVPENQTSTKIRLSISLIDSSVHIQHFEAEQWETIQWDISVSKDPKSIPKRSTSTPNTAANDEELKKLFHTVELDNRTRIVEARQQVEVTHEPIINEMILEAPVQTVSPHPLLLTGLLLLALLFMAALYHYKTRQ